MRRIARWIAVLFLFIIFSGTDVRAHTLLPPVLEEYNGTPADDGLQAEAYRSGRGSYRSPVGGYPGGTRGGVNPGTGARNPGVNPPAGRAPGTPASPAGRFGGFFGGLFAGSLLGSLINPFGFGGFGPGGGFSLIGLLFWAVALYGIYRLVRRMIRGHQ